MSIKQIKESITELQAKIWQNRQYLAHTHKQLAAIYRVTPATAHRSRTQIRSLKAAIDRDSRRLQGLNQALLAAIDAQPSPQIKELLTRRYINDQPFAPIAEAMGYDLRWVYRLHARGLGGHRRVSGKIKNWDNALLLCGHLRIIKLSRNEMRSLRNRITDTRHTSGSQRMQNDDSKGVRK